jgi:hypothetical protein
MEACDKMVLNMTKETVNVYEEKDVEWIGSHFFLRPGAKPTWVIKPCGWVLQPKIYISQLDSLDCPGGIPTKKQYFETPPIPENADAYYIVSKAFREAVKPENRKRLLTTGAPVYEDISNPRQVGYLYLLLG